MAQATTTWDGAAVTFDHPDHVVVAARCCAIEHLEQSRAARESDQPEAARAYADAALRCAQTVATLEKRPAH